MGDIDYVAERGLGAWLRARREKLGLSRIALANAASTSTKTIERYESDKGLGYDTLRILDALGVKWNAGPLKDSPASVNRELRDLRRALEERGAVEPAAWPADLIRRLESVEEKVDSMAHDTSVSLEALAAGIARLEAGRPDAVGQAQGTGG